MELQYPSLSFLATIVLLVLIFIKRVARFKLEGNGKLPPGPSKLPFIGNLHQLVGGMPHRVLCDLARIHDPHLMHLRLGQVDHIVISSAEAAKEITKTHDLNFSSRPPLMATTIIGYNNMGIGFSPYGSYWRQMRKICVLELLSARRVKASSVIREEEVSQLVRNISAISTTNSTVINLTEKLLSLSNTTTSRTAFGAKCKQEERFISVAKRAMMLASGFNLADLYPSYPILGSLSGLRSKLMALQKEMDEILDEIIEEHHAKRGATKGTSQEDDDLVDVLLSVQENGNLDFPLSLTNIKAVILDIFLGGTETTSTTIEWVMAELMRHPDVMKKVQSEVRRVLKGKEKIKDEDLIHLNYMKLVIKETLRLHTPLPLLLPRVCNESCTVMGYNIPKGSRVFINAWAIGRDPRYWEDGESFRPERFEDSSMDYFDCDRIGYMPFGGGRRVCPGMTFGAVNVELVFAHLLYYFDWELPNGMKPEDLDMTESFGPTVGRKYDLFLLAKPHDISLPLS